MIQAIRNYTTNSVALFRSKTVRGAGLVFAGNLAGQGLGFLATLVVIRNLGPTRFGLFSTAIAVMALASQFSDLGISTGFVRYASLYLKEDQRKADILFKLTFYLKLAVGLVVLLLGLVIAKPLATHVFHAPELTQLLRLAFVGSLGVTLWGYLQAILQAKEWFLKYAWINVFNSSVKIIGILLLLFYHQLSEWSAMSVLMIVPFAGFFVDSLIVPKKFLFVKAKAEESREIFNQLFNLSKWVTLSTLCTMFMLRLDVLMLQSMSTSADVGIYNSANQLAMIFPLVTGSLTVSLLPKVSVYKTRDEFLRYIGKVIHIFPLLLVAFGVLIVSSPVFIPIIFGSSYSQSIVIFQVLLSGFLISIIVNPISLIFYAINKARLLAVMNFCQFVIAVPLNYFLIRNFGVVGVSWSGLVIRIFALVFVGYCLSRYFKNGDVQSS
jgi:O-antigen/teichoic acid export membrane protein